MDSGSQHYPILHSSRNWDGMEKQPMEATEKELGSNCEENGMKFVEASGSGIRKNCDMKLGMDWEDS